MIRDIICYIYSIMPYFSLFVIFEKINVVFFIPPIYYTLLYFIQIKVYVSVNIDTTFTIEAILT